MLKVGYCENKKKINIFLGFIIDGPYCSIFSLTVIYYEEYFICEKDVKNVGGLIRRRCLRDIIDLLLTKSKYFL